ncbi:MAG: putative ABC transporter permease [Clostridia bacterium]|nr:putative ABC transporter permease [Clostridia bacterium]
MAKGVNREKRDFQSASLLFFSVSFIGWLFETALCAVQSGHFCDRGFLTLPFCPIYGTPVCIIFLLLGKPSNGRFYKYFLEKIQNGREQVRAISKILLSALSVFLYFFTSAFLATLFELVVGLIFENAGLSLWSYSGMRFCYKGVICLPISLGWGVLMTFFAQFPLPWLEKKLIAIPSRIKRGLTAILWTALLADFLYNTAYYLTNGKHFDYRKYFQR